MLQSVQTPGLNLIGMTMLLQFAVSFGTAIGYALVLLLGATYRSWMGYLVK